MGGKPVCREQMCQKTSSARQRRWSPAAMRCAGWRLMGSAPPAAAGTARAASAPEQATWAALCVPLAGHDPASALEISALAGGHLGGTLGGLPLVRPTAKDPCQQQPWRGECDKGKRLQ